MLPDIQLLCAHLRRRHIEALEIRHEGIRLQDETVGGISRKVLRRPSMRCTMYDMKTSAVTIRMDTDLKRQLNKLCKQTGRTQSELVRDALKRQFAIIRFRQIRRKVLPLAEARGYITDEDVFRDVS